MLIYDRSPYENNSYSYGKYDTVHLKYLIKNLIRSINENSPENFTPSRGWASSTMWTLNNNKLMYSLDPYQAFIRDYDECNGLNYDTYWISILKSGSLLDLDPDDLEDGIAYEVTSSDILKKWIYTYKLGSYKQHNFRSAQKLYV